VGLWWQARSQMLPKGGNYLSPPSSPRSMSPKGVATRLALARTATQADEATPELQAWRGVGKLLRSLEEDVLLTLRRVADM
jgi:hypothetical protein